MPAWCWRKLPLRKLRNTRLGWGSNKFLFALVELIGIWAIINTVSAKTLNMFTSLTVTGWDWPSSC
jgi:hypothetical protein